MRLFCIHILLIVSLININYAFGQSQEKVLFLGDTIYLSPEKYLDFPKSKNKFFKRIAGLDSAYLINNLGTISNSNSKYTFLDPLQDGITKILVIGNSFSDDAVESYFYDMAKSVGKPVVIGNLFRGGAALDFHLKNASTNNKIYSYRKTTIDGIKTNTNRTSILQALKDENWDYICFQQASATSGNWSSVSASLPQLFTYVKENYPISTVQYMYHQTWAYAENATTANFDKYNRDQIIMYDSIVDVSKRVNTLIPIDIMIPSGTAIQNGRTSYIGDNFTREGYHLDMGYGRFTAASTWFESIFGDVLNLPYKPTYISDKDIEIAKHAAYLAVKTPFAISPLKQYGTQEIEDTPFSSIKINFGSLILIPGWNSLLFEKSGSCRYGILDDKNKPTSVNIKVVKSFDSRKANGAKISSFNSGIPSDVSQSYFEVILDSLSNEEPFLKLENLNPEKKYKIIILSTIEQDCNAVQYVVTGDNTSKHLFNPSFNKVNEVVFDKMKPNLSGCIDIGFLVESNIGNRKAVINGLIIAELK